VTTTTATGAANTALFSRIVAATDFSEAATRAVARAAMLASEHGVPLELLHVVRRTGLDELRWAASRARLAERFCNQAREGLDALASSIRLPSPASSRVEVGDVVARIAAHAGRDALLVVGSRGEGNFRDLLLGSTAERLLGRTGGPILVVRAAPAGPYGKVLAALDLAEGSEQVLEAALRASPAAAVTAAHAYDVPFEGMLHRSGVGSEEIDRHRGEALRSAFERIEAMSRRIAPPGRILALAERGHPARLLLDRSTALGADLVVMGRRRRSAAERFFVGSVARHVVAGAASDVLVVPQLGPAVGSDGATSPRASAARPKSR